MSGEESVIHRPSNSSVDQVQESVHEFLTSIFEALVYVRNCSDASKLVDVDEQAQRLFEKYEKVYNQIDTLIGVDKTETEQQSELERLAAELFAAQNGIRTHRQQLQALQSQLAERITQMIPNESIGLSDTLDTPFAV